MRAAPARSEARPLTELRLLAEALTAEIERGRQTEPKPELRKIFERWRERARQIQNLISTIDLDARGARAAGFRHD